MRSIRQQSEKEAFPMALGVVELKAIEALIARAKQFVNDALTIADAAGDVGVVRKIKPLLARVADVEQDIAGRIRAAGQGQP